MLERSPRLSDVPGLVHGFSDRLGGVSTGRYATLNLGRRWGDDPDAVDENLRRLALAGGFDLASLRRVHQVHGAAVLPGAALAPDAQADALWTSREESLVVGVSTADCVPLLLADRRGRVAAAVHSGWRGTVADIAGATVRVLVAEGGLAPDELVAAIGPCIEVDAFEVGEEVAAHFDSTLVARDRGPKPHIDLVGAVRAQLEAAGVPADAIDRVGVCTHAHPDRYFSYRRDGAGIGQMLSFVGFA